MPSPSARRATTFVPFSTVALQRYCGCVHISQQIALYWPAAVAGLSIGVIVRLFLTLRKAPQQRSTTPIAAFAIVLAVCASFTLVKTRPQMPRNPTGDPAAVFFPQKATPPPYKIHVHVA